MNKNTRVPVSFSHELQGGGQGALAKPVVLSLIGHVVFLAAFIVTPSLHIAQPQSQSVINVSMVSLKKDTGDAAKRSAVANKTPQTEKPAVVEKAKAPAPVKKTAKVVEAPPAPKPKTSLKKKTFKSTQVVKQAIAQLEKTAAEKPSPEPQAASPEELKSALDRLRQSVDKTEAAQSKETAKAGAATAGGGAAGDAGAKPGPFNEAGKKKAELIDLYRLEVAFQIQKNWAFNEQLAGGDKSLVAAIVFKVMPNGEIRDIFFTDRSGNQYLDESAYKAIVKSNPVDPHPQGLNQPYVVMAIRFTPQGIR